MADEILTVDEAAQVLKSARITVLRMIKRGELKASRIGKRALRIRRSDIDTMLKANQAEPPA